MSHTLLRFCVGAVIGFYGVALFSNDGRIALMVAVAGGVLVDKVFRNKGEKK